MKLLNSVLTATLILISTAAAHAEYKLGIKARGYPQGGVKILEVEYNSVADDLGMQANDIILAINGRMVNTGLEARDAILNCGGHVTLLVMTCSGRFEQVDADLEEPVVTFALTAPGATAKASPAVPQKTKVKNLTRKAVKK